MTVGLRSDDETGSAVPVPGQSAAGAQPPVGGQSIGPYRLIQPLGEGGMGVVHLALDPKGRAVAIKVLREHIAHDRDARNRLRREVETLTLVQDARVAAVLDADTEGPRPYIVTRYIPGPTLERVVAANGPLQGDALLRLVRGLWEALNVIHRSGVIHRDLKPANVILLDGDPVVIDFGIAHVADDIRLTMTGLVMGTPGYLSPEVVEGAPVTEATDWWGWAATIAFAASGAPPFGRGPMDVVLNRVLHGQADLSRVDQRLVPLLQAALSPVPAERPEAGEIVRALDRYATGTPLTLAIPLAGASAVPQRAPVDEPAREEAGKGDPGPRDRRRGESSRAGTMLALSVGVLGVATIWPMVAIGLVAVWSFLSRFADRSITALQMRRHDRGHRRTDVPMAVASSPWHAVVSVLEMALALVIPAIVAAGATFSTALASAAVTGGDPSPDRSLPIVVGGFLGLLMCWWGAGGASLRRGSRSLLQAVAPGGRGVTDFMLATVTLAGVGLGAWAWVRNGQPEWWPWSLGYLTALQQSFR